MDDPRLGNATPPRDVEAMVRSAANYVRPTDDLRPRTLEAACDRGARRRGRWASVCLLLALLALPSLAALVSQACLPGRYASSSSALLHDRAEDLAPPHRGGIGWGLFEAFRILRDEQATQLGVERSPE